MHIFLLSILFLLFSRYFLLFLFLIMYHFFLDCKLVFFSWSVLHSINIHQMLCVSWFCLFLIIKLINHSHVHCHRGLQLNWKHFLSCRYDSHWLGWNTVFWYTFVVIRITTIAVSAPFWGGILTTAFSTG